MNVHKTANTPKPAGSHFGAALHQMHQTLHQTHLVQARKPVLLHQLHHTPLGVVHWCTDRGLVQRKRSDSMCKFLRGGGERDRRSERAEILNNKKSARIGRARDAANDNDARRNDTPWTRTAISC